LKPTARQTLAICAVLFAVYAVTGLRSKQLDAPWKVDEGQRICEGYSWRLLRAGDVANPDWFRTIAFRTHPPVSKYFYGAAVELAGVPLPRDLGLARAYDSGAGAGTMPAQFEAEYLPMRRPARIASYLLNASTAILLFGVLLWLQGIAPAVLSQFLLFRHYLFGEALFYARSDTVQTFVTAVTIAALLCCVARHSVVCASLAGVFAALAFQTRLNGGVALAMCFAFLLSAGLQRRSLIACAGALSAAFAVVSIAVNPYYWATPRFAPDVPPALLHDTLPWRIVTRFLLQIRELRTLLGGVPPEWHLISIPSRLAFTVSVLFSGKSGVLLAIGIVLSLAMMKVLTATERAMLAWAIAGIVVVAVWIPLRWDMYLLLIVPPAVIASSTGYGAVIRRFTE
jgi:hypothetical protein